MQTRNYFTYLFPPLVPVVGRLLRFCEVLRCEGAAAALRVSRLLPMRGSEAGFAGFAGLR